MFDLLTPENLPATLTGVAGLITAAGGVVLYRKQKEPPKPGTVDAAAQALAENTQATLAMTAGIEKQNNHFAHNNEMFRAMGPKIEVITHDMAEIRRQITEAREHLAAIREHNNRRPR